MYICTRWIILCPDVSTLVAYHNSESPFRNYVGQVCIYISYTTSAYMFVFYLYVYTRWITLCRDVSTLVAYHNSESPFRNDVRQVCVYVYHISIISTLCLYINLYIYTRWITLCHYVSTLVAYHDSESPFRNYVGQVRIYIYLSIYHLYSAYMYIISLYTYTPYISFVAT